MQKILYELAHIGINSDDLENATEIAKTLSELFNMPIRERENSIYVSNAIEIMKAKGRGRLGHIGIYTANCEEAIQDLQCRGYEVDMNTAKHDANGALKVVYLKQEVSGFAIHIIKKA